MIPRMTTVGTLKNYRYNLNQSNYTMGKAMNVVTSRRLFSSYAEDPALATRCFQIRRSYLRAESQYSVNESLRHKYDVAWSALDNISTDLYSRADDASIASIIRSATDSTGPGRLALGQSLCAKAKDIAQIMNGRYGENYVFAGADTLNAPFTWGPQVNPEYVEGGNFPKYLTPDGGTTNDPELASQGLYYRGVPVDSNNPADVEKMEYFLNGERKDIDVGLGHKEANGEAVSSTVFDSSLQGIYYLGGYGTKDGVKVEEDDGTTAGVVDQVPNNVISIVNELGQILQRCDEKTGDWHSKEDELRFRALSQELESTNSDFLERWTEMDTQSSFLRDNSELLTTTKDSLKQQYMELEDADPAAAISDFMFARYCYDAALKVGNSILSQSLMDYMNF